MVGLVSYYKLMKVPALMEYDSVKDSDEHIELLFEWVKRNGGVCNLEVRRDLTTGVRGLYAQRDIKETGTPLVQLPNKLLITPLHVKA